MSVVPARLSTSLRHAWALSWLGSGVEEYVATPGEPVLDEPHARVTRVAPSPEQSGRPVLLVTPLAVPATCWDLRPGQSLAAHLAGAEAASVDGGRPTYVVDYGTIGFGDRAMGFEDWLDRILPRAIRAVSDLHDGGDVHLVGWSLGGTISLLTAARHPDLPIASIAALGTPIDYGLNASTVALRWLDARLGTAAVLAPTAALGGVPSPLVKAVYRATAPVRELTRPWFLLRNLHDRETLARTEAIDRFMAAMPGYPGRFYHQLHSRIIARRELATGTVHLGRAGDVELSRLQVPLLFVGSATDAIATAACVEAGVRAFTGAPSARYVAADGLSHLGLVAAPQARTATWPVIREHLAAHDG